MFLALFLAALGLVLIYLEFFTPGGIIGGGGVFACLTSLYLFFMEGPTFWEGVLFVASLVIALSAFCKLALYQIKKSKRTLSLDESQEGYRASEFEKEFIGKRGIASTELKPAGYIEVEGKQYSALSESGYISKKSPVTIVGGKGSYLIIKEVFNG